MRGGIPLTRSGRPAYFLLNAITILSELRLIQVQNLPGGLLSHCFSEYLFRKSSAGLFIWMDFLKACFLCLNEVPVT